MAFGEHRDRPTIVPPRGTSLTPSPSMGYTPNPRMNRLWDGFSPFLTSRSFKLTPSQLRFARVFFTGANCLLSGEAGTGKSYLVKALFEYLTIHGVSVGRTAPTGVAAFNIGGQTLHSFMGLGLAEEDVPELVLKIHKNRKARDRIRAMEVLFIDEVSMCKGELLDKVNGVLRSIRGKGEPFGGVQLILCGDWLQLPPVFKGDERPELAFQSGSWQSASIRAVVLKEQMRQKDDSVLGNVLGNLRVGDTSNLHLLDSRINAVFPSDGIEAVRIFCKNLDVDQYNKDRLAQLTTPSKVFHAKDTGLPYHTETFNKNCPAPQVLELKVGAQVMLLTNDDTELGLVNGSIGVVQSYGTEGVKVKFKTVTHMVMRSEWHLKEQEVGMDNKIKLKTVATRSQLPLKLCWAVTVHKAQGQTLDRAIIDVAEAFAAGQAYTALSRVRDLQSLSIAGAIPHRAIQVNRDCVRFYEELEDEEDRFAF